MDHMLEPLRQLLNPSKIKVKMILERAQIDTKAEAIYRFNVEWVNKNEFARYIVFSSNQINNERYITSYNS